MPSRTPPPPPPPPPPPGDAPLPPRRITGKEAADAAAAALARGNETFNVAVGRLGERSAQFGLDVEGATASVWPVLGVFTMAAALVVDRLKDVHAVPVRWMLVLLVLGAAVVAGELRRGGRFRALDALPAWATTTGLRLAMLLTLGAQLTAFLSVGIVQVLWWLATILVAVPVVRGHQAVREFRVTGRSVTPELAGAVAVFAALAVGLLPKQGDVGTLWGVVAGLSAVAVVVTSLRTVPYATVVLDVAALLIVGVAVVGGSLTVVGLLWLAAGWLLGSARWRAAVAGTPRPAWRSASALAMVGALVAVAATFGTFDNFQGPGYYSGGHTYSYDTYGGEYGYNYDPFAYYNPGFFWSASGRGQSGAPLEVAALVALAAFARRGGSRDRRVTYVAAAVAVGAFLWVGFSGSLHYFPVWVAAAGIALTIGWSGREAWWARSTPVTAAAGSSGAPPGPPPGRSGQSPARSAR